MKNAVFLLAALLSACAAPRWYRNGATQMDFAGDKQFCALYAQQLNENWTWSRGITTNALFSRCMQERGWTQGE